MTYPNRAAWSVLPAMALGLACMATPNRAIADAQPFVGEIAPMGIVNFCPRGWSEANGAILPVSGNDALFSLLGTAFGGDGRTTFALPDLRGRIPMGEGTGPGLSPRRWGERAGAETVTLNQTQLAPHSHTVNANNLDGDKPGPGGKILAAAPDGGTGTETIYSDQPANVQMSSNMIAPAGRSLPVQIQDPSLVIRYCIALTGIYPSRN